MKYEPITAGNYYHIYNRENNLKDIFKESRKFSNLFNSYAKGINKAYNRNGSLFQDRFSRKRIGNEDYLKNLILYVHLNPVHHGFTEEYNSYSYSSYRSHLSTRKTLLDRKFVTDLFGGKQNFEAAHLQKSINLSQELTLE